MLTSGALQINLRFNEGCDTNKHPSGTVIFTVLHFVYALFLLLLNIRFRILIRGEWRKVHNEELNDLYCSPKIVRVIKSRRMRWAGHIVRIGEGRGVHRVLVGKPEGKRPLGRPRHRWEDNIKMDRQEVGCGGVD
jgi:hypothetical protein